MALTLDADIQFLPGVGKKLGLLLNKLQVYTLKDCMLFFPREYDDRRALPQISSLAHDQVQTLVVVLEDVREKQVKKGVHVIEATVRDATGRMTAVWFNQRYLFSVLRPGLKVLLKGKCEFNLFSQLMQIQVSHSEVFRTEADLKAHVGLVVPVYNLTAGLYQSQIRGIVKQAITRGRGLLRDAVPSDIKQALNLMDLHVALDTLHYPKSVDGYKRARQRIVFDEFFYYQIRLEQQRMAQQNQSKAMQLNEKGTKTSLYLKQLPYALTAAQQRVIEEIKEDLAKPVAMNRLLQGDVGSGKTDVALMTVLIAIENGVSAAIMAPTEILATQHYSKMQMLLAPLGINCCLFKGKMRKREREAMLESLAQNPASVVVGTHALIEDYVGLEKCAVVVIDEQHRFGVMQRNRLRKKAAHPHCLFMTATPIPRSFMLTCYGDLDKSIIDELPPGRVPPKTTVVPHEQANFVYNICAQRLAAGEQVYIVYPLIEESEKIDLQCAEEGLEIARKCFPEYKVEWLHGRMKNAEKDAVMQTFKANECHVLVSTTVIEVGVDVPNASVMVIFDAERFGLSQLHQLRGRIGRGNKASSCYLVAQAKTEVGKQRLKAMVDTTDGFKIAEIDVKLRGAGDVLGTRQSGVPSFQLADIVGDEQALLVARKAAKRVLDEDPKLELEKHRELNEEAQQQMQVSVGLN